MSINIKKAVIHVLDKEAYEPLLNEYEIEINEDVSYFLERHIEKSFNDEDARKAVYKEGINIIKEVCQRIDQDMEYFLEGSKEIARQLFKSMKTNSSISSTDLIICLYEMDDEQYAAVLKMDYTVSFIHEIEMVDDKFKISIKKQDISLPGVNQRIQKCAFIKTGSHNGDYDMVVLDNQISNKKSEEPVAQFFLQTFLDSELVLDKKVCTKIFKQETESWIRSKAKEGEAHVEDVREFVNNVIRQEDEIDIEDFSSKAFKNKEYLREDYINNMKEKGLTTERFEVDRDWVDRKLQKVRIKTESNIEITIDYEHFNDREKFEIIKNPDGTRNIVIKGIISMEEK